MKLIERIDEYKNQLIRFYDSLDTNLQNWRNKDRRLFGYLCSYVPEEVLYAAGIIPIRILGSLAPLTKADSHFQPFVCRLIRSTLDKGLAGNLNHLNGMIISYTCDGMRMLYDTWKQMIPTEHTYLLDLPASLNSDSNKKRFFQINEDFLKDVERYTGNEITNSSLISAIEIYNSYRRLVKRFYYLRQKYVLPVSNSEALKIYLGALLAPKDAFNEIFENFLGVIENWIDSGEKPSSENPIRLHLSGSIVVDPTFLDLVDRVGGLIVSDDLCTGTRNYWDLVENYKENPIEAVIKRYLDKVSCPSKYPASNRFAFLTDRLRESKAKGLIFFGEKYCDPHLFEFPSIREKVESIGIKTLWLETELIASGPEQLITRLETFVDILRSE